MVCIFIKYKSTFFLVIKQISIFIKYRFEFFLKKFSFFILFYKIADFEISKKELRVRLKSFLLICDACIVSLSRECESSFKSIFYVLSKTNLIFTNQVSFFFNFQNRSDLSLKRGHIHKTDLFKLIFVKCLLCVLQHIIQHHTKGYIMVNKV